MIKNINKIGKRMKIERKKRGKKKKKKNSSVSE